LETNAEYKTVASEFGIFRFPSLPAGNYDVKATASGFTSAVVPGVPVHVGIIATVKMDLELADVAERVTVLAEGQQLINTAPAELAALVDRRQMRDLPSADRAAISLLRLQAGVVLASGTNILTASIHGLRANMTNLTQDGVNVQDNGGRDAFRAI